MPRLTTAKATPLGRTPEPEPTAPVVRGFVQTPSPLRTPGSKSGYATPIRASTPLERPLSPLEKLQQQGKPRRPPGKTVENGHYRMMEWNAGESSSGWRSTAKTANIMSSFNYSKSALTIESYMTKGEAQKIKGILERQRGQEHEWKPIRRPSPTRDLEAHRGTIASIGQNSHRPGTASPGSKGNTGKSYYKFYRTTLNEKNAKTADITPPKSKKGKPQFSPMKQYAYTGPPKERPVGKGKRIYPNKSNFDHSLSVIEERKQDKSASPLRPRPKHVRNAFNSSLHGIAGFH